MVEATYTFNDIAVDIRWIYYNLGWFSILYSSHDTGKCLAIGEKERYVRTRHKSNASISYGKK